MTEQNVFVQNGITHLVLLFSMAYIALQENREMRKRVYQATNRITTSLTARTRGYQSNKL